jgi:ABC-type Fe3+-hydroxamate transport system substrate-binding protein
MSGIFTLNDALVMIHQVGQSVGQRERAATLAADIEERFAQLPHLLRPLRVAYFIWQNPYMVAGRQTFIHDMLTRCGFDNVFAETGNGRYPEVSVADIQAATLDAILLSSEPFPFAAKQRQVFQGMCLETAVYLVNGELFLVWQPLVAGSRLLAATDCRYIV